MKILNIMPYSPFPLFYGGALRNYYLLKNMVEKHQVTLVTFGGPSEDLVLVQNLGDHLDEIRVVPKGIIRRNHRLGQIYALWTSHSHDYLEANCDHMQRQLDKLLSREKYDIIQTEFSFMGNYDLPSDAPKILDEHNVEYDIYHQMYQYNRSAVRRMYYHVEYSRMKKEELEICRKHDVILVTSNSDKNKLDHDLPEVPKYVLTNGVDTNYFHPLPTIPEPNSIVFTGMMGYEPNSDAMIFFIDDILPIIKKAIPDVKLFIVGKRPTMKLKTRASDHIFVTGLVDDVRPYIWRSDVYVVPLRIGGGTRLKVLEALAMKKPVVTTSIACDGLDVKDNDTVRIADDPKEFAELVIQILKNQNYSDQIINRGYELVHEYYDWKVIGETLDQLYETILKKHKNKLSDSIKA
ncbi:MAG TPA: glycosyltransferase family 4 protein [Balneolales bacterium]|nr:glycosyltransferase family 4 protein [Balneolales bacterium]